jgi:hypothetical protein
MLASFKVVLSVMLLSPTLDKAVAAGHASIILVVSGLTANPIVYGCEEPSTAFATKNAKLSWQQNKDTRSASGAATSSMHYIPVKLGGVTSGAVSCSCTGCST